MQANNPVGYWRFGEASGTTITDELGNGHTGTYVGSVSLGQTGALSGDSDSAASLSGGWGDITSYSALNPSTAITLEFWWKGTSAPYWVINKGYTSHTDPYYQYGVVGYSGNVGVALDTGLGWPGNLWDSGTAWPTDGDFHMFDVTYDGSTITLYIDGIEKASTSRSGSLNGYATDLGVGDILNLGAGYSSTGTVDDLSIYSTALSASDITTHYGAAVGTLNPPENTAPPAEYGSWYVTGVVHGSDGTWVGYAPISLSYQWKRCDSSGSSCSAISGATSSTYTAQSADVGSTLRFSVTASNGYGSSTETTTQSPVTISSVPTGYVGNVLGDAPVGYWRFGEASGTTITDELDGGHTGTYVGSVSLGQTGAADAGSNTAVSLSGGWGDIGGYSALNPSSAITLEFWWKGSSPNWVINKGYTSHTDPYYQYGVLDNSGKVAIALDTGLGWPGNLWTTSIDWPSDSNFHMYDVTYDGSTITLYIDGAEKTTTSRSGTLNGYSSDLGVGDLLNLGTGYNSTGTIDELSIYSYALDASQISTHYEAAGIEDLSLPSIPSDPKDGGNYTVSTGSWSGSPTSYSYQWQSCTSSTVCSDISGATTNSYSPDASVYGLALRVNVTASNSLSSNTVSTAVTDPVGDFFEGRFGFLALGGGSSLAGTRASIQANSTSPDDGGCVLFRSDVENIADQELIQAGLEHCGSGASSDCGSEASTDIVAYTEIHDSMGFTCHTAGSVLADFSYLISVQEDSLTVWHTYIGGAEQDLPMNFTDSPTLFGESGEHGTTDLTNSCSGWSGEGTFGADTPWQTYNLSSDTWTDVSSPYYVSKGCWETSGAPSSSFTISHS